MEVDVELIKKAFKKLKSSAYYDKTNLSLRRDIVKYEAEKEPGELEKRFEFLADAIRDGGAIFDKLTESILSGVSVNSFPKSVYKESQPEIISNAEKQYVEVDKLQHFISMSIEGHILGVLWVMLIGFKLDETLYQHSYGNRIRKQLYSELSEDITYSPYLFQPYYRLYENWRDTALSEAQRLLKDKQDVVVLTLDFRSYYYSLDLDDKLFTDILDQAKQASKKQKQITDESILQRINGFVKDVVRKYADCFDEYENRCILPIGFLPSNILGNWCLSRFDQAVVDGWNPIYYGRYVDDIIIVDKVEKNSDIYEAAKCNCLKREEAIQYYLTNCSKWRGINAKAFCDKDNTFALFKLDETETEKEKIKARAAQKSEKDVERIKVYRVNPRYNVSEDNKSHIVLQNDKVKVFYFCEDETDALITCFRDTLAKNRSEFRHLPDDEDVFLYDKYDGIYDLRSADTINKFRGVESLSLNKYELSKFLGKYLKIGAMIRDRSESKFEKDILRIFNHQAIIENYGVWEKLIEILVVNERFDELINVINRINEAIGVIKLVRDAEESSQNVEAVKENLNHYLYASLERSMALVWKKKARVALGKIIQEMYSEISIDSCILMAENYLKTRMVNQNLIPVQVDMINKEEIKTKEVNLSVFSEVISIMKDSWDSEYLYYPYILSLSEFSMIECMETVRTGNGEQRDLRHSFSEQYDRYARANYSCKREDLSKKSKWIIPEVKALNIKNKNADSGNGESVGCANGDNLGSSTYVVSVGDSKTSALHIAVANVGTNYTDFKKIVQNKPNRSYQRYKDIAQMVNCAIDNKADMIVLPEAYMPYEWLPVVAKTCAKNRLALITGVEHILDEKTGTAYNFTAVILPYCEDKENDYWTACTFFHLKKHYAPAEDELIRAYRYVPVEGSRYELFRWNDCYFPVYCCYELASITDRSIFQSYADMIIAVEWNKDVNYYSNILESLSRDIHCYCVQVNYSEYGDSRITKPSSTETKDLLRTKGGKNNTVLVEKVDYSDLRDFQIKGYSLQQKDKSFKPTPPNFDKNIVLMKTMGKPII